jgi:hypothetical protein
MKVLTTLFLLTSVSREPMFKNASSQMIPSNLGLFLPLPEDKLPKPNNESVHGIYNL